MSPDLKPFDEFIINRKVIRQAAALFLSFVFVLLIRLSKQAAVSLILLLFDVIL